ncbi:MAG: glycoside hydrolase family 88 protein [Bacteroidota bacterium]|nr:glycoside hydrolase family 88 protein [Bacteroidota bacterium]
MKKRTVACVLTLILITVTIGQVAGANDTSTPLHLLKPHYPVPYGIVKPEAVKAKTDRIRSYLEKSTYPRLQKRFFLTSNSKFEQIDAHSRLARGKFRLASYEWGVTYTGMLNVADMTHDTAYSRYVLQRFDFLVAVAPGFKNRLKHGQSIDEQMKQVLTPAALDDAGSICAAMIRTAMKYGKETAYRQLIDNYMDYILHKQFRLNDGTFARNRPFHNSVWLDDMYMSLPALAQYSKYTKNGTYVEEAARQILLFRDKMFVPEKGLFRHGWVQGMEPHPSFFWGRANGWAILTMCDVLDVLPESSPYRASVLSLLKAHLAGLATLQSGTGFWHQLLDRNDSYLETSCTAIFTYCIAHAINEGWIEPMPYGPVALLGWNALSTRITSTGLVKGTCVGTGMGFDPAYYNYRSVRSAAAHGYGPALLAGAEIIRLLDKQHPKINDSAIQFYRTDQQTDKRIFNENELPTQ